MKRFFQLFSIAAAIGTTGIPAFAQDVITPSDGRNVAKTEPTAAGAAVAPANDDWIAPKIVLYGSGKVTSPDANPDDIAASGGFGLGYVSDLLQLHLSVHKGTSNEIGATLGTDGVVKPGSASEYGYTVLDPSSASTSYLLRAFWYPKDFKKRGAILKLRSRAGFGGYMMTSNVTWVYPSTTAGELAKRNVTSFAVAPCGGIIGRGKAGDTVATLFANACLSYRVIGGDVATKSSDDLRMQLIGTKKKDFVGPELEVGGQIGNLGISARVSYFFGGDADGLSGLRFVPTITGVIPVGFPLSDG